MNDGAALLADLPRWAFGLALLLARTGAALMLLPGLGEAGIPPTIRAGFAFAMVLLVLPGLMPAMPVPPAHPAALAAMLGAELLSGTILGWLARLAVLALPMAGHVISHMLGLTNVLQPDADLGGQASALERLFGLAASTFVLASGLYALPLAALAGSYRLVPPGGAGLAADAPGALVAALGESFALSLQLAAPVVLLGLLWHLALGLAGRLVPRLQIYFIAMPGQIFLGLAALGLLSAVILPVWAEQLRAILARLPGLG